MFTSQVLIGIKRGTVCLVLCCTPVLSKHQCLPPVEQKQNQMSVTHEQGLPVSLSSQHPSSGISQNIHPLVAATPAHAHM